VDGITLRPVEPLSGGQCLCVFGSGLSGKTYLLRASIRAAHPAQSFLVYDFGQHYGPVCDRSVEGVRELAAALPWLLSAPARIQVLSGGDDPAAEVVALCRLAATLRRTTVVVDEADVVLENCWSEQLKPIRPLISTGRHKGSGLWVGAKRPADVLKSLIGQARMLVARPTDAATAEYFRKVFGEVDWTRLAEHEFYLLFEGVREGRVRVNADGRLEVREP